MEPTVRVMTRGALAVAAVLAGSVAPAGAEGVYSGGCELELTVTPSVILGVEPAQMRLDLTGGGTCVTNGGLAWLDFSAAVFTDPDTGGFGCAGGVAAGTGFVDLDLPGFSGLPVEVTVLVAGPAATLLATANVTRLDGVGVLAQNPADAAACPSVGLATTTWTGGFAFQDPELPGRSAD